ncbi:hypothetical protein ACHAXA_011148 [Cyclostephanos tholiformis]|uniref:N-acetyltransferase domain-containing protein n=1 Tax=Cyclostephanos tholiformis TaxID=382380 RepID=A0ABD3SF82_9STRA
MDPKAALSQTATRKGLSPNSLSSTSSTVASTAASSVSSYNASGDYPALITPMMLQQSLKEKKQKLHLAMEKALGWGKNKNSTPSSFGAAYVEPIQRPDSVEQHNVTENRHHRQQVVKKHKLTTLSSLVNSLTVAPSIPHRFISMEEEINNNVSSTPPTEPRCFSLLKEFYDELMISTFPLEEEREELNDWMNCFRLQMHARQSPEKRQRLAERTMLLDVILMIQDDDNDGEHKILGGAAINYYSHSRVGLLSYIVLRDEYRGCGLAKLLHEEALVRIEMLANYYYDSIDDSASKHSSQSLRAIFAETNTPAAGDITPTQCLIRHKSLYNLGYRLVKFPYSQPPLSNENGVNATFDEIVLLVYFPLSNDDLATMNYIKERDDCTFDPMRSKRELLMRYCSWFFEKNHNDETINHCSLSDTVKMNVNVPLGFIEDFYRDQFPSKNAFCDGDDVDLVDRGKCNSSDDWIIMPDYCTADYYTFAHWFADHCQQHEGIVDVYLCPPSYAPWEDCKELFFVKWKEQKKGDIRISPQDRI